MMTPVRVGDAEHVNGVFDLVTVAPVAIKVLSGKLWIV